MRRLILLLIFFAPSFALALEVRILGTLPRDKVISDSEVLKVYWEADTNGTYSVKVSSSYVTERFVDNYRDLPYTSGLSYTFTIDPLRDLTDETGSTVDDTYTITLEFRSGSDTARDSISFILDNPPEVPTGFKATPGDEYVHLSWDRHRDNDIREFRIYYDTTPSPYPESPTDADYLNVKVVEGRETTGVDITGLINGETYYFSIVAVDGYNNTSEFAPEISAVPRFEYGFSSFSDEDVGCIIAVTAGDSEEILSHARDIRNILLKKIPFLVKFYYAWSGLVIAGGKRDGGGRLLEMILGALTVCAVFLFSPYGAFAGLFALFFLVAGKFRKRKFPAVLLFFALFIPSSAKAESPMNFYLNIKVGNMKFEYSALWEYWAKIYGPGGHASVWGELGYEIPWKKYGTWIVSGTGGIFWEKGYGLIPADTGELGLGGKDLQFYLVPLGSGITYLARYFKNQYVIPFGNFGVVGYFFYEKKKNGDTIKKGVVGGFYTGVGALILLDWIEPEYADKLDIDSGINNTYILLEYRWSFVNGFGKYSDFDFSHNTFFAGLAFEF